MGLALGRCRGSRWAYSPHPNPQVAELRAARTEANPATFALGKKLARYPVNGRRPSLRDVATELEKVGHLTSAGTRYGAAAIARMIAA
jgi:hypothetical protein